jgi:hypothetical protein
LREVRGFLSLTELKDVILYLLSVRKNIPLPPNTVKYFLKVKPRPAEVLKISAV